MSKSKSKARSNSKTEIFGNITIDDNIKLLNLELEEEQKFNNPTIGFQWVAQRYVENREQYGIPLYEAETIKFVDTDVFRQTALRYNKYGKYCPYIQEHDPLQYFRWWEREEYRRKHGMTAYAGLNEDGTPRLVWCPPKLYGFLNYALIFKVKEEDEKTVFEEYEELRPKNGFQLAEDKLNELFKSITDKKVATKVSGFPEFFDGQYHVAIARMFAKRIGKNFFYGKARRKGQSYFNGWCAIDNMDLYPKTTTILAAYDKLYLTKGDGALMSMVVAYSDWLNNNTDWKKNRTPDTIEHIRYAYKFKGEQVERGFKSEVIAVSAQANPNVAVGKDCYELCYEELGVFPNFTESYGVTSSTVEAGEFTVGQIIGWGTGGTKDANWAGFEDVMYNPDAYNALACNNIWDKGKIGTACCYFYPHVQALEGCMDEFGNTDYKLAWERYRTKKDAARKELGDTDKFRIWCGQRANSPEEAFSRASNNIFPAEAIQAQLNFVLHESKVKNAAKYGKYRHNAHGKLEFLTNVELEHLGLPFHPPIENYPLKKGDDPHGCVVIYEPPYRDEFGRTPPDLYIAAQDPYAHDKGDVKNIKLRDSLGATFIYERPNAFTRSKGGILVATYIGRPPMLDDYNHQAMLLLEDYNAKMMFENDRGDTKSYMQRMKRLDFLYNEPELQFAKDVSGKTGRNYGMHMTDDRIAKAAIYLRDLLNAPLTYDEFAGTYKTFLNYIYCPATLIELLKWYPQGNFDRVSALLILMYVIQEVKDKELEPPPAYEEDSFFGRELF